MTDPYATDNNNKNNRKNDLPRPEKITSTPRNAHLCVLRMVKDPDIRKNDYKSFIETRTGDDVLELMFSYDDDTYSSVLFYPRTLRGAQNALVLFQQYDVKIMEPPPSRDDLWDVRTRDEEVQTFRKQNVPLTGIFYLWDVKKRKHFSRTNEPLLG